MLATSQTQTRHRPDSGLVDRPSVSHTRNRHLHPSKECHPPSSVSPALFHVTPTRTHLASELPPPPGSKTRNLSACYKKNPTKIKIKKQGLRQVHSLSAVNQGQRLPERFEATSSNWSESSRADFGRSAAVDALFRVPEKNEKWWFHSLEPCGRRSFRSGRRLLRQPGPSSSARRETRPAAFDGLAHSAPNNDRGQRRTARASSAATFTGRRTLRSIITTRTQPGSSRCAAKEATMRERRECEFTNLRVVRRRQLW